MQLVTFERRGPDEEDRERGALHSMGDLGFDSLEPSTTGMRRLGAVIDAGPDAEIYRTALCTLMLEVYYRYLPATDTKGSRPKSGLDSLKDN